VGVVDESVRSLPAPALRPFIAYYSGYQQAGVEPGRHRGLPSPYLTLIFTLDDPLTVAAHPDPRQPPSEYGTLLGGLHISPALITHQGWQSGIQLALSLCVPKTSSKSCDQAIFVDRAVGASRCTMARRVGPSNGSLICRRSSVGPRSVLAVCLGVVSSRADRAAGKRRSRAGSASCLILSARTGTSFPMARQTIVTIADDIDGSEGTGPHLQS
jgi:hypothetical protein